MRRLIASILALALAQGSAPFAMAADPPAAAPNPPNTVMPGWPCPVGTFTGVQDTVTPLHPWQTKAPPPARPSSYQYAVVASGLEHPWSVAFLPGGGYLVTERPGRLRIVSAGGTLSPPLAGMPEIGATANEGLHDLLLAKDFAKTRLFYFTYFAPPADGHKVTTAEYRNWIESPAGLHTPGVVGQPRIARARLSQDMTRVTDVQTIFDGANRRLAWAPDGKLLATMSATVSGTSAVDGEAQRTDNTYGKVLRLNPDGSVPKDNPFVGKAGYEPALFDLGHRDMQGAAVNPRTGQLWTTEHGPRGGDELNIIKAGRNYGFPTISYGREYSGAQINGGKSAQAGMEQPVYFWTPSIGPSGLTFYSGKLFPEWRNSLFLGAQPGRRLIRLELKGDRVVAEEPLLADRCKRVRDVREGPDGALYVLTEEVNGELLRITPKKK